MGIFIRIISVFVAIYIILAAFAMLAGLGAAISYAFSKYKTENELITKSEFISKFKTENALFPLVTFPASIHKLPTFIKDVKGFISFVWAAKTDTDDK